MASVSGALVNSGQTDGQRLSHEWPCLRSSDVDLEGNRDTLELLNKQVTSDLGFKKTMLGSNVMGGLRGVESTGKELSQQSQ